MVRDNLDSNTAPWDPIWSFLVGDHDKLLKKTIENPEETQTQQLPPKTQTPTNLFPVLLNSGVDHRDDHQSHHSYESSVDSLNRTITLSESTDTEDYTANSPWHWELDDTYFTGIDDDTPDPEDMNKRKVRFSPFKQVSLLEYTLTSVVDDKFRQSFDKNDFANAHDLQEPDGVFSLSEFLENWREFSTSDESVCQDSTYTETNDFKTPQDDSKRSMNGYSMLSNSLNNETHINDNKLQHSLETKSISKKQNIPKPDFDDDMESSPDIPLAYGVRIDQDHYNSIPSGMDDVCSPDVVIAKPLTSSRFSRFSGRGFGMTKWSRTKSQSRSQSQSQVQIKLGGGAKIHEMNSNGFSQIASTSSFNNRGDETLTGAATIPITSSHIGHSSLQVESENLGQYNQNALFEYDYESGNQISLSYSEFGLEPKFLAMVEKSNKQSFLASRQEAIVQIEASTVSQTDSQLRLGKMWKNKSTQLPNTPGVDFVGKIMNIDPRTSNRYGLAINDRVISLSNFGGNARYISTVSSKLVKVPASIDPVKAVCLAETYLAAFQTLHHGQDNSVRYMKSSMKRKSILVCGSLISNLGHALAQLSKIAGVENIFATSKPKYFKQLESMGFIPLNVDSILWLEKLKGCLDLVISLDEPIVSLYLKSLKSSGELVVVSNAQNPILPQNKFNIVCDRRKSQERSKIYYYDVYERWELDLERSKRDLSHLLKSLDKNEFQPHIIDRIPLAKVAKAHELIGSKRLPGFVVCEPWLVKKAKVISL